MKNPSELVARNHEGSHPADVMAVRALSVDECRNQKQNHYAVVNYVAVDVRDGDAVVGHKKGLNRVRAFSECVTDDDSGNPHEPDSVLDVISPSLLRCLVGEGRKTFAHASRGTKKSAPETTEKHPGQKHQRKDNEASVDDVLHRRHDDEVGREVPDCDWKKQHGDDDCEPPDFLQCHKKPPVPFAKYTWYDFDYTNAK